PSCFTNEQQVQALQRLLRILDLNDWLELARKIDPTNYDPLPYQLIRKRTISRLQQLIQSFSSPAFGALATETIPLSEISALCAKLDYFRSYSYLIPERTEDIEKTYQQLGEKLKSSCSPDLGKPKYKLINIFLMPELNINNPKIKQLKELIEKEKKAVMEQVGACLTELVLNTIPSINQTNFAENFYNTYNELLTRLCAFLEEDLSTLLNDLDSNLESRTSIDYRPQIHRLETQVEDYRAELNEFHRTNTELKTENDTLKIELKKRQENNDAKWKRISNELDCLKAEKEKYLFQLKD
ncbi:2869_t:CDS:2, partial [Funneliformis geosporum]